MTLSYPATHRQVRYFESVESGWSADSVPTIMRVHGQLDLNAMRGALADLVQRHASFRTRLVRTETGITQFIDEGSAVQLHEGDGETLGVPFLVQGGHMLRAELCRVDRGEHLLAIVAHHAVSDGWSSALICRDLSELYRSRREMRAARLPPVGINMGDYAVWERQALGRDVGDYWHERLGSGHARLRYGRGCVADAEPAEEVVWALPTLSPESVGRLRTIALECGTTLPRVIGACVIAAIARYADSEITVRWMTANRRRAELRDVVGCLAEALPVRVDLSGDPTFRGLSRRYDAAVSGAYDHVFPAAGLERVVRQNPQRRSGPLFDLELNFLVPSGTAHGKDAGGPGLTAADDVDPWWEWKGQAVDRWLDWFPVLNFAHELLEDGRVRGSLLVNETAIRPGDAEQLVTRVNRVIERVSQEPDTRLGSL